MRDQNWSEQQEIDELLAGANTEEEIVAPGELMAQLTKLVDHQ